MNKNLSLKYDALLLAVFKKFRNMFLEIYWLELSKPLSASELAWQAALK